MHPVLLGCTAHEKYIPPMQNKLTGLTAGLSATILTVVALVAGWNRRWISDDGLIVLRTVRNLQAGNGPVFNAGERVETNTSALWQYLIYLWAQLTGGQLETVALWCALICTGLAVLAGVLGSGLLYRQRGLVLLPVGMVIYLALPPARDFATSGLEWGLSILWLAVLWLLLAMWVRRGNPAAYAARGGAQSRRHARPVLRPAKPYLYLLAFWTGLSWLVRPELALYGGVAGLVLLIATPGWLRKLSVLAVALPVPMAYQIFRMGYYGAIVPQTAVAKSASEAMWGRGWDYVTDFVEPYGVCWALGVLAAVSAVVVWGVGAQRERVPRAAHRLQQPVTPVFVMVLCALLHMVYVVRVGGDFMHGRMLLIPLFALLLPVALLPVVGFRSAEETELAPIAFAGRDEPSGEPEPIGEREAMGHPELSTEAMRSTRPSRTARSVHPLAWAQAAAVTLGFAFCVAWGINAVNHPVVWSSDGVTGPNDLNIVDERTYWMQRTHGSVDNPPLYATDYMDMDLMGGYERANRECAEQRASQPDAVECRGALLSIGKPGQPGEFDWVPTPGMATVVASSEGREGEIRPGPRGGFGDLGYHPMTISFLNLGMTGMIAPLDVRVVDPMGLANPLAARMPQIDGGRPGHDKYLPIEWQMADSSADVDKLPVFIDREEVEQARRALYTPELVELFHTYRQPMSLQRFLVNLKYSLTVSRELKLSDDVDDYAGQALMEDAQIAWPRER